MHNFFCLVERYGNLVVVGESAGIRIPETQGKKALGSSFCKTPEFPKPAYEEKKTVHQNSRKNV